MPYRTFENVIEGVVLTLIDITGLKKAEEEVRKARDYAENIVNTIREPLVVLDGDLKVVSASRSFYHNFRETPQKTEGCYLYNLGNREWDIPRLRELLETVLPQNTSFEDMEVEHDFPTIGHRKILLNARRIPGKTGEKQLILLAIEDVTYRQLRELKGDPGKEGR
jgi:two-component system CheB/CheR fusion protein